MFLSVWINKTDFKLNFSNILNKMLKNSHLHKDFIWQWSLLFTRHKTRSEARCSFKVYYKKNASLCEKYLSVFNQNARKHGPEKLRIWTLFM